jgi:GDP-4-dehydro-6-deoxy-D-mannose reductase
VRVLITGISGFVGGHLATYLLHTSDVEIFGVVRQPETVLPGLRSMVTSFYGDLLDVDFVSEVSAEVQPQQVYHLAGQASVSEAWANPWNTLCLNVQPQFNLLQALLKHQLAPKILSVTSSKVYGDVPSMEMPILETHLLMPDNPYGVSKAAQDLAAQQYFLSHNLPIIRARAFNHIGPRQSADFVTAAFARQVARAEAGLSEPVTKVGNLAAARDFTDVRDVVRAYALLMKKGSPGEAYNIGSGQAVPVQSLLDTLLDLATLEIDVQPDPARMRPVDHPISYGDISKIRQAIGWEPHISLEQSLADILDYWRAQTQLEMT